MSEANDQVRQADPATHRCSTCADEGTEGRILALREGALAEVELEGQVHEVALDLLDEVAVGDRVLVHAGLAIAHLGREASCSCPTNPLA